MTSLDRSPERRQPAPGVRLLALQDPRFKRAVLEVHFDRPLAAGSPARTLLAQVLQQGTARHGSRMAWHRAQEDLYGATVELDADRLADAHRSTLGVTWVGRRFLPGSSGVGDRARGLGRELLDAPLRGPDSEPFIPEVVERERRELLRRIRTLQEDRGAFARERFLGHLCAGEAYGRPPWGTPEEVQALSASDLEAARTDLLRHAEVTAVAVGPVEAGALETWLARWLGAEPDRRAIPAPVPGRPGELREVREDLDVDQARFLLGFRFPPPESGADAEALLLASSLLGGGAHGRLFRVVREERSLAYGIWSVLRTRKGILVVEAGIDAGAYGAVRDEVLAQVADVAAGRFDESELEMARANLLNDLRALGDSASSLARFLARERHLGLDRTPAERAATLLGLGREEVMAAAAGWRPDLAYLLASAPDPVPAGAED